MWVTNIVWSHNYSDCCFLHPAQFLDPVRRLHLLPLPLLLRWQCQSKLWWSWHCVPFPSKTATVVWCKPASLEHLVLVPSCHNGDWLDQCNHDRTRNHWEIASAWNLAVPQFHILQILQSRIQPANIFVWLLLFLVLFRTSDYQKSYVAFILIQKYQQFCWYLQD